MIKTTEATAEADKIFWIEKRKLIQLTNELYDHNDRLFNHSGHLPLGDRLAQYKAISDELLPKIEEQREVVRIAHQAYCDTLVY